MFTTVFFLITTAFAIIWSFVFLPLGIFNIKIQRITGQRMTRFLKKVKFSSIWVDNQPDGWICGYWYIGYIHKTNGTHNSGDSKDLYILCSDNFYKEHIELKQTDEGGKTTKITYYEREGVFWRLYYNSRPIDLPKKPILPNQKSAIHNILNKYNQQEYVRVLLYGKPGTGKSMTGQYLCQKLLETYKSVSFVDTFNPFEQGDSFASMYTKINPTKESPLVIMMEEIDINIMKIHKDDVKLSEHIPIQIKNKCDWNGFLDKFDRNLYPYVVLMMTTNKSSSFFDEHDPSYMRPGRIDLKIEF